MKKGDFGTNQGTNLQPLTDLLLLRSLGKVPHIPAAPADNAMAQCEFFLKTEPFLRSKAETNGVTERFNRTLKEQVIHGRVFKHIEQVRSAITALRITTIISVLEN